MGFSGKPSKGCLPCRQKRTKCDLALPSCTQCIRKNRICFGYRNEQDMVFRNETGSVIRKVKRKSASPEETGEVGDDEGAFAKLDFGALLVQHPSRRATLQEEAIMHYLANFNEKLFSSSNELEAGFEYILPIYRADVARGGPVVGILNACGLAALGNSKNSPDLLRAARVKQVQVLRQLNEQLQDPNYALSDSSLLTCLLLSSFENIMCEGSNSMAASQTHLLGAATLVRLRGRSQFAGLIGHGMFVRLRGSMLALSLLTSKPLPKYFLSFISEEKLSDTDFEVMFYNFMSRVCALRALQKHTGSVNLAMVAEARSLLAFYADWDPEYPKWVYPPHSRPPTKRDTNGEFIAKGADKAHHFVWVALSFLLQKTACILVYEVLIVYYRTQQSVCPSPSTASLLEDVTREQIALSTLVKDAVEYYLHNFVSSQATTRSIGAHMLMMPLSILLSTSTAGRDTFLWIARTASKLAEAFALKQGKMVADFLMMGVRAETFALSPTKEPVVDNGKGAVDGEVEVEVGVRGEEEVAEEGRPLFPVT